MSESVVIPAGSLREGETVEVSGSVRWETASDPIEDLRRAAEAIRRHTGYRQPNQILIPHGVYLRLLWHTYATAKRALDRLQTILRKKHVAGQQWKRRRQRVAGKFGRVWAKQHAARLALPEAQRAAHEAYQEWLRAGGKE